MFKNKDFLDKEKKRGKVYVGVSGGVDSSVSLAILKEQGFDVVGVFLKVWSPDFLPCNWKEERRSAMAVCAKVGVPFKTLDCQEQYKEKIVNYMIESYKKGKTPNPDIFCNKYIKFGIFLEKALEDGADFVATGHYAQKIKTEDGFGLYKGLDEKKDQSYFLCQINQRQLSKILLPVGHLQKSEVRKLAEKYKLPTAFKKDSQGLCFIGKVDMKDFLKHYIDEKKGDIFDTSNRKVGEHDGVFFYTIGERVATPLLKEDDDKKRYFVIKKDIEKNILFVSTKENQKESAVNEIKIKNIQENSDIKIEENKTFDVYTRYHGEKNVGTIKKDGDQLKVVLEKPEFAVSEGQILAFYIADRCVGGAEIV